MINIKICVFPGDNCYSLNFDENKTFEDLKNDLQEKQIIKKGVCYIEMNDNIMDDDMILKNNGVKKNSYINVVRNESIKIKLKIKDLVNKVQVIKKYMLISDLKVIKVNENNEVKVC